MRVHAEEIGSPCRIGRSGMMEVLREALRNVREFHLHQEDESWEFYAGEGVRLGVRNTAIGQRGFVCSRRQGRLSFIRTDERDSCAGCRRGSNRCGHSAESCLQENPLIAAALDLLELDEVYRIGGAQAVAALAYGTRNVFRAWTRSSAPAINTSRRRSAWFTEWSTST